MKTFAWILWVGLGVAVSAGAVTNGLICTRAHNGVVQLNKSDEGLCSAVFVSPTKALTAAHCLRSVPGCGVTLWGSSPVSCKIRPEYLKLKADGSRDRIRVASEDIAVLTFAPRAVASAAVRQYFPPHRGKVEKGLPVFLAGYGDDSALPGLEMGSGKCRYGKNRVLEFSEDGKSLIYFRGVTIGRGNGVDVGVGSGDSGGALFSADYRLMGVINGSAADPDNALQHYWVALNLQRKGLRELVEAAIRAP